MKFISGFGVSRRDPLVGLVRFVALRANQMREVVL